MPRLVVWIVAAALMSIGVYVRTSGLWAWYFSPDDLLHLEISAGPGLAGVWSNAADQMHPPLVFFLLHALEQVTLDERFFRFLPVLPGAAVPVALFFLGRSVCGNVAGLAMTYLAAFSYGAIILSQVIRPYSLLVVLLAAALGCFVAWSRRPERRHLWGYGLLMGAAMLLHYSAAFVMLAVAGVQVGAAVLGKRLRRETRSILAVHLPLCALLGVLYVVHVSQLTGLYAAVRDTYLRPFFPVDAAGYGRAAAGFFGFHFLDANWGWGCALAGLGLVALWRRQRPVAALVVTTFAINLSLTWLDRYPFGGRQSMYLLPLTALLIGAAAQWMFEFLRRALGRLAEHRLAPAAAGAALLASTIPIVGGYARSDFLRRHPNAGGYAVAEFPLLRADFEAAMTLLRTQVRPGDAILANRQTGHYFRFLTDYRQGEYLSRSDAEVVPLTLGDLRVFVVPQFLFFDTGMELLRGLRKLGRNVDLAATPRVWIVNFGWGSPVERIHRNSPIFQTTLRTVLLARGCSVHVIDGSTALAEVERQR